MTAQEVIELAREAYPGFSDRHTPDPLALRFLTGYQRTLLTKLARLRPDDFSTWDTVALPLAVFEDGAPLTPAVLRIGGDVTVQGRTPPERQKLHIVPYEERYSSRVWPAVGIVSDTVYPLGLEADWNAYSELRIRYVAQPPAVAAAATVLAVPDEAFECVSAALQKFFAMRGPAEKHVIAHAQNWASVKEAELLDQIAGRSMGVTSLKPDVW